MLVQPDSRPTLQSHFFYKDSRLRGKPRRGSKANSLRRPDPRLILVAIGGRMLRVSVIHNKGPKPKDLMPASFRGQDWKDMVCI